MTPIGAIDDNLAHLQIWMPWAMAEPSALEVIEERIAKFEEQFDSGVEWLFAIRSRSTDAVLGGAGLHPRGGPHGLEIDCWLQASTTGNRFATEAAEALTRVALGQPGIDRVQIRCDPKNIASAGIPRRLAFRHVLTIENETFAPAGSLRDTMVWEIDSGTVSPSCAGANFGVGSSPSGRTAGELGPMCAKASTKKDSGARIARVPWRVVGLEVRPDYRLFVRFADGTEGEVDIKPFLFEGDAGVFEHLRNPGEFEKAYVHQGAVTWPGELDLAPDAMYDDIKATGRRIAGRQPGQP